MLKKCYIEIKIVMRTKQKILFFILWIFFYFYKLMEYTWNIFRIYLKLVYSIIKLEVALSLLIYFFIK